MFGGDYNTEIQKSRMDKHFGEGDGLPTIME